MLYEVITIPGYSDIEGSVSSITPFSFIDFNPVKCVKNTLNYQYLDSAENLIPGRILSNISESIIFNPYQLSRDTVLYMYDRRTPGNAYLDYEKEILFPGSAFRLEKYIA